MNFVGMVNIRYCIPKRSLCAEIELGKSVLHVDCHCFIFICVLWVLVLLSATVAEYGGYNFMQISVYEM